MFESKWPSPLSSFFRIRPAAWTMRAEPLSFKKKKIKKPLTCLTGAGVPASPSLGALRVGFFKSTQRTPMRDGGFPGEPCRLLPGFCTR